MLLTGNLLNSQCGKFQNSLLKCEVVGAPSVRCTASRGGYCERIRGISGLDKKQSSTVLIQ